MENYILKKKNKNKKIVKLNFKEEGYLFKPNIKNPKLIKISNLSLLNIKHTSPILEKKMTQSFHKLASMVYPILNDEEASSGDAVIALNEITKQKGIVLRKYKNYIKEQEREKTLKRLRVLEKEMKAKLLYIKEREEVLEEGRGR